MRFATLVFATTALLGTARAQRTKDTGASLFEEGKELTRQGKYTEACDRFARSYELERATGTLVNYADCQEHLGRVARAWQLFDSAAAQSDREGNGVRAEYARQRANVLVSRLGAITIRVEEPDPSMRLTVGGRDLEPAAETKTYVDPGEVEIVARAGGKQFAKTVAVRAGRSATVEVPKLGSSSSGRERKRSWVIAAAALGTGGLVGLGGSALLTLSASRRYADTFAEGECFHTDRGAECTASGLARVDDARSRANLATGLFAGSLALVGAAVIVYVIAPRETLEMSPIVGGDEAGVSISGRF